jgi:DNA-binding transcriptional ArsR family regulator
MPATLQIVQSPEKAAVLLQPGRLGMVEFLVEPDSAAGLARRLGIPRQKANYHLRELEREGFLELFEERRKGNCIERVLRSTAREFLIAPPHVGKGVTADRFSAAYLVSTAARVIRDLATLCLRARKAGKRLATLTLETEIRFASAESRAAFAEDLTASIAHLAAKYHNERAEGGRRFRVVSAAYPAIKHEESSNESANLE